MPSLPAPPLLPPRDLGWLAQMLPVSGSLVSVGVLSAANGHGLIAVVIVATTLLGSVIGIDQHRERWRRDVARARISYAGTLAALVPGSDWTEPFAPPGSDPVALLLAQRAAAGLKRAAAVPAKERSAAVTWVEPDLRAELADDCWLDLREAAAGGVGPHGVIVGATGSGKSELLQALVLSLALRHRPRDLTFVLIDFKGGAALEELACLPHCAGLITNLAHDPAAVPRMVRALEAELDRRQRVARLGQGGAGGLVRPGGPAGSAGPRQPGLPRLASLVVVIDEFSELLSAHPAVIDVLVRIGRLGRSLGIHLVLASQRLEESRMRDLEAHLSWRLALRTFTENESRAAIGLPSAAALPREPGWALLRTGPEAPRRFRVAPAPGEFRAAAIAQLCEAAERTPGGVAGERATPIWLPPLRTSPLARTLSSGVGTDSRWVPVGLSDDPVQRRVVGLDPRTGHVAVVGRPGSGKSWLLTAFAEGAFDRGFRVRRLDQVATMLSGPGVVPDWDRVCGAGEATVLLVDDWGVLRQERPDLEDIVARAAVAEPRVRLVVAAHRWADVRLGLRDLVTTRIELRLSDPFDSVFDRHRAAAVPLDRPGWGLFDGEPFLAARPTHPIPPLTGPNPGFDRVEFRL